MLNTTSASIPYPESTDLPEANKHQQLLAEAVDLLTIPAFSSASTRDSTITSPTNGQSAYLQDTEETSIYKSGYSAWMKVGRPHIMKIKTADETVTNSSTLQNDNHIVNLSLKASTNYIVRGIWYFTSNSAGDIKFFWNFSSAPTQGFWCLKYNLNGSSTDDMFQQSWSQGQGPIHPCSGGVNLVGLVEGQVITAAATTVTLQWAQGTADPGIATLQAGSHIEFIESI